MEFIFEVRSVYKCRLRIIFAERDIRQGVFVKKLGVSQSALSSIVNNRSLPSFDVAYKISKELGMDIKDIWVEENG